MFFELFPLIPYNQNFGLKRTSFEAVTDIFFRTKFREIIKNENINYYSYSVRDGETPERIASEYYGNPTDHWIILYANDIVDPFYDWPLTSKNFNEYIKEKYGSLEYAQTTTRHYEKVLTTTDSRSDVVTVRKFEIDYDDPRINIGEEIPYDDYQSLAVDNYVNVPGTFKDGSGVDVVISRSSQTIYDWEYEKNEAKRNIKLIRNDYLPAIRREMDAFRLQALKTPYFREIREY